VGLGDLDRLAPGGVRDRHPGLGRGQHPPRRDQGRDQPRLPGQQQLDGLVVQVDAVLDRPDPGPQGRLDAVGGLGVGHHPAAGGGRLGDQGGQLVVAEVGVAGVVGGGEDAAAGGDLDDVGPGPDQLAHLAPHGLGPVD